MTVTDSTISGNTAHRTTFPLGSFGEGGGISSNNDIPDTDPANDPDDTTTIVFALIHPSAWNRNSTKFALIGFCELRLMRVLRSLLVVGGPSSIKITSST
jgi:hypothetical protein